MFESIPLVTTGFTLVAFIVAAVVMITRQRLKRDQELIETANEDDRYDLIARVQEKWNLKLDDLSRADRKELALAQLSGRLQTNKIVVGVVISAVVLLFSLAAFSLWRAYPEQKCQVSCDDIKALGKTVLLIDERIDAHDLNGADVHVDVLVDKLTDMNEQCKK